MFRKLSFKRDRNHSSQTGRKHSGRSKSHRNAILGVERLELREMLAVNPILSIPAGQFFGAGISAVPFRADFTDQIEVSGVNELFECYIDWDDTDGTDDEEQITAHSFEQTPFNTAPLEALNPIVGRIEGFPEYSAPGDYNVTIRLVDGHLNETVETVTVSVYPVDNTLNVGGLSAPQTYEGDTWSVSLERESGDVIDSWNVNWGEGAIQSFNDGDLTPDVDAGLADHVYVDDDRFEPSYYVSATATRGGNTVFAGWTTVGVDDVEPLTLISGAATANQGESYELTLSNIDQGNDPIAGWLIFWSDTEVEAVPGNPPTLTHVYNDPDEYVINAIAFDDDGQQYLPLVPVLVTVTGAASGTSLVDGTLFINGSTTGTGNDTAVISLSGGNVSVNASVNGTNPFVAPISSVNAIVVDLGNGNDILVALPNMNITMTINGGEGNDLITAGGGDDVIDGGPGVDIVFASGGDDVVLGGIGNDDLFGGNGNDVLIGGDGVDILSGDAGRDLLIGSADEDLLSSGNGEDILIGGSTDYDGYNDINSTAGIDAIMAIWTGNGNFTSRVNDLLASNLLQPSALFDDDATDLILGGSGRDLVFGDSSTAGDGVVDLIALNLVQDVLIAVN